MNEIFLLSETWERYKILLFIQNLIMFFPQLNPFLFLKFSILYRKLNITKYNGRVLKMCTLELGTKYFAYSSL